MKMKIGKKIWSVLLAAALLTSGSYAEEYVPESTVTVVTSIVEETTAESASETTAPETTAKAETEPPRPDNPDTFLGQLYGHLSEEDLVYLLICADGSRYTGEAILGENGFEAPQPPTEAWIIGYEGIASTLEVPAEIEGVPVTKIADYAFRQDAYPKKILLPDSIVEIGRAAFEGCESLREIRIGEGCLRIGDSAFSGCKELRTAELSASLTEIGEEAFFGCRQIRVLRLGSSLRRIGDDAFMGCERLRVRCEGEVANAYAEKWHLTLSGDYTEERNFAIVAGVLLAAVIVWTVLKVRQYRRKKADIAAKRAALEAKKAGGEES